MVFYNPDMVAVSGNRTLLDRHERHVYTLTLFLAIFLPTFHAYLGSFGAVLVNSSIIAVLSIELLILNLMSDRFGFDRVAQSLLFYLMMYFLFIVVSIMVGHIFGGVSVGLRDVFELHRPVLYFLVLFFSYRFAKYSGGQVFFTVLIAVFFGIAALGLIQYFHVSDLTISLYTKQHNINSGRVSAPFVNPYDYAFIMSFFVILFFVKVVEGYYKYLLPLLIAAVMMLMTQSRSVVGGFFLGFILVVPLVLLVTKVALRNYRIDSTVWNIVLLFVFAVLCLAISLPVIMEKLPYLTYQFVRFFNGEGIGVSASIRLGQLEFALDKAQNPIILYFGNGPAKQEMEYVESIYIYFLYRYGVVGFFLYFVVPWLVGLICSYKAIRLVRRDNAFLFLSILCWMSIVPFLVIGNNFTEQVRLSFFYYSLIGLSMGAAFQFNDGKAR